MTDETRLGKYLLMEQLGRGGYGTVYRARDTVLNVERAVKVLHPALLADPEFIERFRHEARMVARLEHPHIVTVYDLGEEAGTIYLAMRYLRAGSLKDVLAGKRPLPFNVAVQITCQVASALDYAHHLPEQLIHRDVKPGNILFETKGSAFLSDFGFAKALHGENSASVSRSGSMIGTPLYMPPELWNSQSPLPQTDIYSLACVLYEMLTCQALFGCEDTQMPMAIMKRHFEAVRLPATWPTGVPSALGPVLEIALAKLPSQRYPDMAAFTTALADLSGQPFLAVSASPARPVENTSTQSDTQPKPNPAGVPITVAIPSKMPASARPMPAARSAVRPGWNSLPWISLGWAVSAALGWAIGWQDKASILLVLGWAICGAIGGFFTAQALWKEQIIKIWINVPLISLGWAVAWAVGWPIAAALNWSGNWGVGWAIGWIIAWAIGAFITAWVLHKEQGWTASKNLLFITLGWAVIGTVGWSINLFASTLIFKAMGGALVDTFLWKGGFTILMAVAGSIAGAFVGALGGMLVIRRLKGKK